VDTFNELETRPMEKRDFIFFWHKHEILFCMVQTIFASSNFLPPLSPSLPPPLAALSLASLWIAALCTYVGARLNGLAGQKSSSNRERLDETHAADGNDGAT